MAEAIDTTRKETIRNISLKQDLHLSKLEMQHTGRAADGENVGFESNRALVDGDKKVG